MQGQKKRQPVCHWELKIKWHPQSDAICYLPIILSQALI
jgi:hypothetical protein